MKVEITYRDQAGLSREPGYEWAVVADDGRILTGGLTHDRDTAVRLADEALDLRHARATERAADLLAGVHTRDDEGEES